MSSSPLARLSTFLRRKHEGSVFMTTVLVIGLIGAASLMIFVFQLLAVRMMQARNLTAKNQMAAESAIRVMTERLVSLSAARLGEVTVSDLDSLEANLSGTVPLPENISLDIGQSGYSMNGPFGGGIVPSDERPLAETPDAPRSAYAVPPLAGGLRGGSTRIIEVTTAVTGVRGGTRAAQQRIVLTHVPPFQYALRTEGDIEVCASGGDAFVSGKVRAHGSIVLPCAQRTAWAGDLLAQDSLIVNASGLHELRWDGGSKNLKTESRSAMEGNVEGELQEWDGRVRFVGALGDRMVRTQLQTGSVAGSGECPDFGASCSGLGVYFPSVQLQHTKTGNDSTFDLSCGWAYADTGTSCGAVGDAVTYHPYPFTTSGTAGQARMDPAVPGHVWHGLFPEYRREERCTAELSNGTSWRTFRCPTNPYGYVIDVSQLPPITGGVLSILQASTSSSVNNPSGYQEVVVVRNASVLLGPLTIHSEIPVYMEGSFNNSSQVPAMIDAPLITVLPASTPEQVAEVAVWDSVSTTSHKQLRARGDARIYAVLRSEYHRTGSGGDYGGTLNQIPSVLGDWDAVSVSVFGAVEGIERSTGAPDSYAANFAPYGSEPSGMITTQPNARWIIYDPMLREPGFQPPGSWNAQNTPAIGAGGTRTEARQQNAFGGFSVVRYLRGPLDGATTSFP